MSAPAGRVDVTHVATPVAPFTGTDAQVGIAVPLSVKAMLPEKAVLPFAVAGTVATVAVKVTGVLNVALVGLAVSVVAVVAALTFCVRGALLFELELKFGSPLKATVMVWEPMVSPEYEHVTTPLAGGVVAGHAVARPTWDGSVMLTLPARATPPEGAESVLVKVTD